MEILRIENLKKAFADKEVLKGVNLSIKSNTIYGFVGKNGAGKTTTMKMILGLLKIDEGRIFVNGKEVTYGDNETNKFIGYLPDVPEFYNYMNAREYLKLCGQISGMKSDEIKKRSDELLERVGLSGEKKKIKGYSRGMKQRLGIAAALFSRPKLLICDEPTSALDPIGRKELLEILLEAKKETTVIFSTHILSDVEKICDEMAFLNDGKIVLSGKISDIKNKNRKNRFVINSDGHNDELKNHFRCLESINADELLLKDVDKLPEILGYMGSEDIIPLKIERLEPSVEDLFVEVTGE